MWSPRTGRDDHVTCVACGRSIVRSDAREYDKEGDRWSRTGKEFEHVCKNCHRDLNHQPRNELEELLIEAECSTSMTQEEFIRQYNRIVEERYGSLEK